MFRIPTASALALLLAANIEAQSCLESKRIHPTSTLQHLYQIRMFDPANLLILGHNVLLLSRDSGKTWQEQSVKPMGRDIPLGALAVVDSRTAYLGGDDGIIQVTRDTGRTWSVHPTGLADLEAVHPASGGAMYLETSGDVVYKFHPDQDTVRRLFSGRPGMTLIFNDSTAVFATRREVSRYYGPLGCLVQRTADGGKTWSAFDAGGSGCSAERADDSTAYLYINGEGLLRTADLGWTWRKAEGSFLMSPHRGYWAKYGTGYDMLFLDSLRGYRAGLEGRIYRTSDGGMGWSQFLPEKMDGSLVSIAFTSENEGYLLSSLLHRTLDGGFTWTTREPPPARELKRLIPTPGGGLMAVGTGGRIFRRPSAGSAWDSITLPSKVEINDLRFVDSSLAFLAAGLEPGVLPHRALLMKSTDAGATWTSISNPFTSSLRAVQFLDAETGFVQVNERLHQRLHRTRDGGKTWTAVMESPVVRDFGFLPGGFGLAYNGTYLNRTEDYGTTWEPVSLPGAEGLRYVRIEDANNIIVLDGTYQVFYSWDEARTWERTRVDVPFNGPLSQGSEAIFSHNNGILYRLGYAKCLQGPPLGIHPARTGPAAMRAQTRRREANGIRFIRGKDQAYDAAGKTQK